MADDTVRISELPGAGVLSGIELVPLVKDGVTSTRSVQNIVQESGLAAHELASDPHDQYAFRVINNLVATTNPAVSNDSTEGYEVLSRWVNVSTAEIFLCLNASVGAAEWQEATLTIDDLGSAALANVGAGNGLDADLLDGQQGAFYLDFANFTSIPDPVVTLSGDVSGDATMTDLGSITISVSVNESSNLQGQGGAFYLDFSNFTSIPDPTVELSGDVTGSATMTDLSSINITVQVNDNSHNHTIANVTQLQTTLDENAAQATGDAISFAIALG